MKSFHSGVICPQNPKLGGGHSEQVTGQGMHWREILFTPRCSSRSLDNFFIRRTAAELQGVKIAQFSDFGLFSPYKTPKNSGEARGFTVGGL